MSGRHRKQGVKKKPLQGGFKTPSRRSTPQSGDSSPSDAVVAPDGSFLPPPVPPLRLTASQTPLRDEAKSKGNTISSSSMAPTHTFSAMDTTASDTSISITSASATGVGTLTSAAFVAPNTTQTTSSHNPMGDTASGLSNSNSSSSSLSNSSSSSGSGLTNNNKRSRSRSRSHSPKRPKRSSKDEKRKSKKPAKGKELKFFCTKHGKNSTHNTEDCLSLKQEKKSSSKSKDGAQDNKNKGKAKDDDICKHCGYSGHDPDRCWSLAKNARNRPDDWKPSKKRKG